MAFVCYGTGAGGTTLDSDSEGGNPLASALIEAARDPSLRLRHLAPRLRRLTKVKSGGHQIVESSGLIRLPDWRFGGASERREALVLIVSNYATFPASPSLAGAAFDERRVAAMLASHGFSVTQGVAPGRKALVDALTTFAARSRRADVALIYSTGHGIQVGDVVHLLPGDYPMRDGLTAARVRRYGVSVPRMVRAASARRQNLVFFAGCRSHLR